MFFLALSEELPVILLFLPVYLVFFLGGGEGGKIKNKISH